MSFQVDVDEDTEYEEEEELPEGDEGRSSAEPIATFQV